MVKFLGNEKSWTVVVDLGEWRKAHSKCLHLKIPRKMVNESWNLEGPMRTHTFSMSRDLGSTHTLTAVSIPNGQISVSKYHSPGKETSTPGRVLMLDIKYMTHKRKI